MLKLFLIFTIVSQILVTAYAQTQSGPVLPPALTEQEINSLANNIADIYFFHNKEKIQNYVDYQHGIISGKQTRITNIEKAIISNKVQEIVANNYITQIKNDIRFKLKNKASSLAIQNIKFQLGIIKNHRAGCLKEINECNQVYQIDEMNLHQLKSQTYSPEAPFNKQLLSLTDYSNGQNAYKEIMQNSKYYFSSLELEQLAKNKNNIEKFAADFVSTYETFYHKLTPNTQSNFFEAGQSYSKTDLLNDEFMAQFNREAQNYFSQNLYSTYSTMKSELCSIYLDTYTSEKEAAERPKIVILSSSINRGESDLEELTVHAEVENVGLGTESQVNFHLKNAKGAIILTQIVQDQIEPFEKMFYTLKYKLKTNLAPHLKGLGNNEFVLETQTHWNKSNAKLNFNFSEEDLLKIIAEHSNDSLIFDLRKIILVELAKEWTDRAELFSSPKNYYQLNSAFMRKIFNASKKQARGVLKNVLLSEDVSSFNAALNDIKSNNKFSILHPFDYKKAQDFLSMYNELTK